MATLVATAAAEEELPQPHPLEDLAAQQLQRPRTGPGARPHVSPGQRPRGPLRFCAAIRSSHDLVGLKQGRGRNSFSLIIEFPTQVGACQVKILTTKLVLRILVALTLK